MSRYIDADVLKKHYAWWGDDNETKQIMDSIVDQQPTIEVEPVKRGGWEDTPTTIEVMELIGCPYSTRVFKCSHCGNIEVSKSRYCRVCGAKMY